jgi:hypothetical protein
MGEGILVDEGLAKGIPVDIHGKTVIVPKKEPKGHLQVGAATTMIQWIKLLLLWEQDILSSCRKWNQVLSDALD